ncbi:MAG: hypothetical protein LC769_13495, partial [Chloroflexi bacterium]|nr:hypothetical protein [Chloroflexota bacterium]
MPHTRARPTSRLLATLVIPALVVAAAALADIAPALAGGPAHRAATSGAHHAHACRARSARSRSAAKGSRSRSRKPACRHRVARAARRRSVAAPVLSAQGQTLSWTSVYNSTSYVLATIRHPDTTPDTTYSVVSGTSMTPPPVPGETLKYGVRANVDAAPWSNEVAITYPASPPPPAPPADTTAPDTTITSGPAATTTSASASFAFTGTD